MKPATANEPVDGLAALTGRLFCGLASGAFLSMPAALFEVRIGLAALVDAAVRLEVQWPAGAATCIRAVAKRTVAWRAGHGNPRSCRFSRRASCS
jgi:hypothetical protein